LHLEARISFVGHLRLRLPDSLHHQLNGLTAAAGISVEQFVTTAVAEKISLLSPDYLQERARRGSRAKYEAALAQAPDIEPPEDDAAARAGWDAAFRMMADRGDDRLLDPDGPGSSWDEKDWEW
jgi:hypothetical protein